MEAGGVLKKERRKDERKKIFCGGDIDCNNVASGISDG
jgi:hypothetical protein